MIYSILYALILNLSTSRNDHYFQKYEMTFSVYKILIQLSFLRIIYVEQQQQQQKWI